MIEDIFERMKNRDPKAFGDLIEHTYERLHVTVHRVLRGYPGVRRWEQTSDVLHKALAKLVEQPGKVPLDSTDRFFAWYERVIRNCVIDLLRHYHGPEGMGAKHASSPSGQDSEGNPQLGHEAETSTYDPLKLAQCTEFFEAMGKLPDDERQVLCLLFFEGLSRKDAATRLGVTERTVHRREQSALLRLPEPPW